ncbi:MAG: hypothetical protein QOI42_634, partial [Frankiaceae bacterium]|nr:hypothetical protein [Frankiaceae bacterium]
RSAQPRRPATTTRTAIAAATAAAAPAWGGQCRANGGTSGRPAAAGLPTRVARVVPPPTNRSQTTTSHQGADATAAIPRWETVRSEATRSRYLPALRGMIAPRAGRGSSYLPDEGFAPPSRVVITIGCRERGTHCTERAEAHRGGSVEGKPGHRLGAGQALDRPAQAIRAGREHSRPGGVDGAQLRLRASHAERVGRRSPRPGRCHPGAQGRELTSPRRAG